MEAGEIVALASALIAFDTTTRAHPDEPARDEAALGFLATRFRGSGGGRPLLLNGHIDVVPGDPDQFRPRVERDRLIAAALGSWYDGATFALEAGTRRPCTARGTSPARTRSTSSSRSATS